ncbi:MAG: 3-hydroxyacyl-CoA dehydrogenase family protein [Alphaproteobacteria bacterium]|jgi:3-hydroxyacyl-CoA dehydrogenase|nr:3-hydroxyacyl-CoA dehydrogenase family protein [Alphaproteobacteria bacterium]
MTTSRRIEKVAVMGSGTMGAGIAAHCAANGIEVLLLDMASDEGPRSAIAATAKARMTEGRSPLLDDADNAGRIQTGNFEDDLGRVAEADLIVEAIVEDLGAKRDLFQRLEAVRRDGSILATNTSGIRLAAIAESMPPRLRRDVAVTHFFNPVKVMKLVELVPGEATEAEVVTALDEFLSDRLGKGVVHAKDTVNFIANRIGCFWLLAGLSEADVALADDLSIEAIDAAMSAPVGVPPTGLFGLVDLIGLDVMGLVATNLAENLAEGDAGRDCLPMPAEIRAMLDRGQLGRKTGGGFYRMTKTEGGGRLRETYDYKSDVWHESESVTLPEAEQTLEGLLFSDSAIGRYAWRVMGGTLLYAAGLVPEISDNLVGIDRAMRWGFAWRQGPFQMLDALGPDRVIARLEAEGQAVPAMLQVLQGAGATSFYRADGAEYLGTDGAYHTVS